MAERETAGNCLRSSSVLDRLRQKFLLNGGGDHGLFVAILDPGLLILCD
jgi:hypothetical protein